MNDRFRIFLQESTNFDDYSRQLAQFETPSVAIQLLIDVTPNSLWIGFKKPFSYFYLDFKVLNTEVNDLTIEYYNITSLTYVDVPNLRDETEGFTKSGFIMYDNPVDNQGLSKWELSTVNGVELYWLKITTDTDHDLTTEINGINILFSNDNDLVAERSNIVSKHATDQPTLSWVIKHQASRDEIVQNLRNQGKRKVTEGGITLPDYVRDLTPFDILNLDQIRSASKYLTLAKIFKQELSDEADDKYFSLGQEFEKKYQAAFDLFLLSLDSDDDGIEDADENIKDQKRINLTWS